MNIEEKKHIDAQYREFLKTAAGRDLMEYLEKSNESTMKSAKLGTGYSVSGEAKGLEPHQIHNFLGRSVAFDQIREYIKRRVAKNTTPKTS